ncbi:hypothetical protein AYX13_01590 [Cryptococcus neoformans]|nr:hypothetical protein AYX13_01590 [Cryptococcus neoformans var. grubii]
MPKTTNPRAKPSLAKPRLQTKAKTSRQPSSSSADMSLLPSSPKHDASLDLDKDLVHQIVLAKLQSSKTCDWHALSQKLNQDGKRGSGKKKEITGTELHDLYHNERKGNTESRPKRTSATKGKSRMVDRGVRWFRKIRMGGRLTRKVD